MKCLKVDEYIKRTASVKETELLLQELKSYVKSPPGLQGRTLCDRVIRACNHHLGAGSPDFDHVGLLVQLVEVSLHGYDVSAAVVAQSTPLYMEKIIFHIVKKLSSLEAQSLCSHVAGLLYSRLTPPQQAEDYCVLVRSCFSVLWNGLSATKDRKIVNPRDKLRCQMQALSFLLLLDAESASTPISKAPIYAEDAVTEFESSCGAMTKDDADFLLQEMRALFKRCWTASEGCKGDRSEQSAETSGLYVLSEMVLIVLKVLCKAGHYGPASTLVHEIESRIRDRADGQCTVAALGKWAVKIHSAMKAGGESGQALTECARALRSLPAVLGDQEAHAVLEGCGLVVWAVESGHSKGLSGSVLLAWFSFLEEHQERLLKMLKKDLTGQAEGSRLQQALCFSIYQGFVFAYESMLASQLEDSDTLDRVLLYCQATAGQMMTELRKLQSENFLIKAVIAVSNLACGLYNRRLYDQAFTLVEILCRDLCKSCPASLSVDRLSRPFMLAVQTSRRAGQLERALDWVILWLKALGDKITTHMAEPVSLWVKTKTDAARNSEEDVRLSTAVDFVHEALRLLEEEPETPENADRLKDDKAHALLWLYVCTLEKNLQEAIERDKKQRELREQTRCVANPIGTNDFDYEDKQKTQDSIQVYEGLHFNLGAENKLCKPLERALDEWSALLQSGALPSPLKALEAYQLAIGLSRHLADAHGSASSLCQSASILLDMGTPELALAQLEQAEKFLTSDCTADGPSSLSMMAILLKAQYCYSTGQVDLGVPYLCDVLKEVNEQRQSKSWYLLRARTLHICSSYLSLDTAALPQVQRASITQHGIKSPDTALYESLKLLCSLLVTLVGKGLYGSNGGSSDVRFIDQAGDNLVLKWQLLSELLNCSVKMVAVRTNCGAINDARLQCLEALKLAIKLQALSQCAELLVIKAELELMQGEREESRIDLDKVRNLLELCTDFSDQVQKTEVKIKPRKGRPVQKSQSPLPTIEDDFKGILSTRWIAKEPVVRDLASSPPLKAQPRRWLSSLAHDADCQCPCCSEPCLGRATARWATTQADLVLQLDPNEARVSFKLQWATLARCKSVSAKLGAKLAKLFPPCGPAKGFTKPNLMQDLVGRVYLRMALFGLEPRHEKVCGIWKVLEAGLAFVDSTPSPVLRPMKAGLLVTKAIVSLVTLAAKKGCTPQELFSHVWTWNARKVDEELKSEQKVALPSSLLKKPKNADVSDNTKEAKKVKVVKPKIQVTSSATKAKGLVPMTPVTVKSKTSIRELGSFDFNTVVPTLACTPVHKVKAPASVQKAPRTASKLQFHVYEEVSPTQAKARPVPAAPRRTKKSRFKVEFSDESDTEASTQTEPKESTDVPKKRTTTRRAAQNSKTAPDPPAEKIPPKRQTRAKKSTAVARVTSSDDDETLVVKAASTRRGRSRRELSNAEADSVEEPDKMRTIEEETTEVLDISIEQLRTSDTEIEDNSASSKDIDVDFEVLRRDMCCDLERDDLFELRSRGHLREGPQTHLSHPDTRPDNLSLEDVQSLLRSAWLTLQHFPSPTIYTTLCGLLALTTGQQDPITTAMLHAQSLGITSRHRTSRHLASCLKKLKKASNELADKMDALSLDELSPSEPKTCTEQMLSQLENIFAFPDS
ncbi:Separin [Nibea albiflora]|uniref:Separin n=1 Tax=Nibea albiflora TaxID=240163 RepID=A0ACB7F4C4_NIBAL|nr:Separin [Nibea albiflora]